ncbi:MAG: VOC family protein [Alphaproteobacteria bacterium]
MPDEVLRIDYVELVASDFDQIRHFYSNAFGWTFKEWGGKDQGGYLEILGAGLSGGFRKVDEPPPTSGTLVILYANDLKAAADAVLANGGKITSHESFPGGKRFHFLDPCGNALAVWTKDDPTTSSSSA